MNISDHVLREYLKHVYFITGMPCAGKTTMAAALGRRFGCRVYNADEAFDTHRALSDPRLHPAMNCSFASADAFFSRTVEEYKTWLTNSTREHMDFVLLDLIRLSAEGPVVCDMDVTPAEADRLTVPGRIVFLLRNPSTIMEEYCTRPDHKGFRDFLYSASDVESARTTCGRTLEELNRNRYGQVKESRYFWLDREDGYTVEEGITRIAEHFGWNKNA